MLEVRLLEWLVKFHPQTQKKSKTPSTETTKTCETTMDLFAEAKCVHFFLWSLGSRRWNPPPRVVWLWFLLRTSTTRLFSSAVLAVNLKWKNLYWHSRAVCATVWGWVSLIHSNEVPSLASWRVSWVECLRVIDPGKTWKKQHGRQLLHWVHWSSSRRMLLQSMRWRWWQSCAWEPKRLELLCDLDFPCDLFFLVLFHVSRGP